MRPVAAYDESHRRLFDDAYALMTQPAPRALPPGPAQPGLPLR